MKEKYKLKPSLKQQERCPDVPFFFTGIGIPGRIWIHLRLPKSMKNFAKFC
jgi:hypothetical protein